MVRSLLAKLALFAFALFLTSLFLEVGLRIAFYRSKDFSMEMWKYAVQLKRPVPDSNLSFAHAPTAKPSDGGRCKDQLTRPARLRIPSD